MCACFFLEYTYSYRPPGHHCRLLLTVGLVVVAKVVYIAKQCALLSLMPYTLCIFIPQTCLRVLLLLPPSSPSYTEPSFVSYIMCTALFQLLLGWMAIVLPLLLLVVYFCYCSCCRCCCGLQALPIYINISAASLSLPSCFSSAIKYEKHGRFYYMAPMACRPLLKCCRSAAFFSSLSFLSLSLSRRSSPVPAAHS